MRIDDLAALAVPSAPALSPDGSAVAYVLRTQDQDADRACDQLWLAPTDGGEPHRLTAGPADRAPAWSPDGRRLAFLRDGQVAVLTLGSADPVVLTDLDLGAGAPAWSPDSSRLAFSAAVAPAGWDDTAPLVSDGIDYRADGSGLIGGIRPQLHVLDVATGKTEQLTEGTLGTGDPVWSPDGTRLAFTRRTGADSDLEPRIGVYLISPGVPGAPGASSSPGRPSASDTPDPTSTPDYASPPDQASAPSQASAPRTPDTTSTPTEPELVALGTGLAATVDFSADGSALLITGYPGGPSGHAHLFRVPLDRSALGNTSPPPATHLATAAIDGASATAAPLNTTPPSAASLSATSPSAPPHGAPPLSAAPPHATASTVPSLDTAPHHSAPINTAPMNAAPPTATSPTPTAPTAASVEVAPLTATSSTSTAPTAASVEAAPPTAASPEAPLTVTASAKAPSEGTASFGTEPVSLTAHLDRNVMPGAPAYPGGRPAELDGRILFCIRDRGRTRLWSVAPDGTQAAPVPMDPDTVVGGLSVAAGRVAVALTSPTSFGEIALVDIADGTTTFLTAHGDPEIDLFVPQERTFTVSDGTDIHGWVTSSTSQGPRPLLLDIHGGPHNAWSGTADEMHLYQQELVAQGWTVLTLNPRGSDGYGEAFFTGVHGAWGVADAADFLEPVAQLVAEGLADPERLAITGYSYGGFMTCWLTAHDQRFVVAVAGGVVSDLVSLAGTSDEGHLLAAHELGGALGQRADRYAPMSPLTQVADVRTPTLILHGGADLLCPVGQAQQWHTALRELDVPTRLVLYPGGSHAFVLNGRPSHRIDYSRRVVDWVNQYTGRPSIDAAHWQERLSVLARRHQVVGAQLGILRLGEPEEVTVATHGVLNRATNVPTTPDSVFQIGSITKVWTATLVLQLVAEGRLDLDDPIGKVLPRLRLADPEAVRTVTIRHLLTHTSGIDGDIFTDTGRGDDCLARYADLLAEAGINHPPGATWSYCNSGYSLLGLVVEELTGGTWDQALRERLLTPLGLSSTVTLPEEALRFAAAIGHEDGEPVAVWGLPRSVGPAGLITSTARDVLAFARLHLTGGLAEDGDRVLAAEAAEAMAAHAVDLPDPYVLGDSWGLGWIRFDWDGHRLIGHDGSTLGQNAYLRILPEQGLAVTLLTNGGHTQDLYQELFREIFAEVAGVTMSRSLTPPAEPVQVDVGPYTGTYERASTRIEIEDGETGPLMRTTVTGPLAELIPDPVDEYPMVAVRPGLFLVRPPGSLTWIPLTFYQIKDGTSYLHFGARATPRTA